MANTMKFAIGKAKNKTRVFNFLFKYVTDNLFYIPLFLKKKKKINFSRKKNSICVLFIKATFLANFDGD